MLTCAASSCRQLAGYGATDTSAVHDAAPSESSVVDDLSGREGIGVEDRGLPSSEGASIPSDGPSKDGPSKDGPSKDGPSSTDGAIADVGAHDQRPLDAGPVVLTCIEEFSTTLSPVEAVWTNQPSDGYAATYVGLYERGSPWTNVGLFASVPVAMAGDATWLAVADTLGALHVRNHTLATSKDQHISFGSLGLRDVAMQSGKVLVALANEVIPYDPVGQQKEQTLGLVSQLATGDVVNSVWADGARVVVAGKRAVGGGFVRQRTSASWSLPITGPVVWRAGWGSAGENFVVGDAGYVGHGSTTLTTTQATSVPLNAVWGRSKTDVYAVGQAGAFLHFDGTSWSPVASTYPAKLANNYTDVWGAGNALLIGIKRPTGGAVVRCTLP